MCHGSGLGWGLPPVSYTQLVHIPLPFSFLHKNIELGKQGRPGKIYHMNDVSWTGGVFLVKHALDFIGFFRRLRAVENIQLTGKQLGLKGFMCAFW